MPDAKCPVMIDAPHSVEWMEVPASTHNGDFGTWITPGYRRGICLDCGEQFTS